jgi:hypothetical protein
MRARTRAYRALVWLYPPRFRREYGESMTQLYSDLERARAQRPFWRVLAELAITVPYQYWEAFVATTPITRATITVVFTAVIAAASIAFGATIIGLLVLLLLAWELYAVLRMRGQGLALSSRAWWQFLLAGVGVFVAVFVIFALPWPESWRSQVPGEVAFFCVMGGISLSLVLVATGLMMGIGRLALRRRGA